MTTPKVITEIRITIRFYEELNDFLKNYSTKEDIVFSFNGKRSIKDLIESFGVPHVEVDLILVNGNSEGFEYIIQNNDRISVYPMFESYNVKAISKVRVKPLRDTKFVLDVHLGKLARYLRLLGFDTDYKRYRDDPELAIISQNEKRILLTCDRKLLMRSIVTHGLIIRASDPRRQILEILNRLDLWDDIKPFTRCLTCNSEIREIKEKSDEFNSIYSELPPNVKSWCKEISKCIGCNKVYWKGTHYDKLELFVDEIINEKKRRT